MYNTTTEFLNLVKAVKEVTICHFIHFILSFNHLEFSNFNISCSLANHIDTDRTKWCLGFRLNVCCVHKT